ncbi:hypothetical protein BDN67DRAFT_905103, partial [Paxillus ammoniavirescens]
YMSVVEGTVYLYCACVSRALRSIQDSHLAWPGEIRRDFLSSEMLELGFPGCIRIADGSYIPLLYKPTENGYAYWCREKYYAVSLYSGSTCDHQAIFTSYDFGWPGSVQDSCVFKNSHMWRNRETYFHSHVYILVDKGK